MKICYINNSATIIIDPENPNSEISSLDSKIESISRIYMATEPMKVIYGNGEQREEYDVDKDDIIIRFYRDEFKHHIVIVKSNEWVENIKDYDEKMQKQREDWAKNKQEEIPTCDCGC